jgi:type I restriction enzyme R subunit
MRHLLDTYIRAEESEKLSAFDDLTLVQLIVERGEAAVDSLPEGIRKDREAMAETIENNVRRLIIDEMAVNPKYYEKMSELLDSLIEQRRREALDYRAYLGRIVELTRQVSKPESQTPYPAAINTGALRALYDNLEVDVTPVGEPSTHYRFDRASGARETLAVTLDQAIRAVKKADWRGNRFKEREVRNAIRDKLGEDDERIEQIFEIVKAQREY